MRMRKQVFHPERSTLLIAELSHAECKPDNTEALKLLYS
jgi:hypothetical protein